MPAKSRSQLRAINAKANRGEMPQEVADEFNKASKGRKLPERVKPKKTRKAKKKR